MLCCTLWWKLGPASHVSCLVKQLSALQLRCCSAGRCAVCLLLRPLSSPLRCQPAAAQPKTLAPTSSQPESQPESLAPTSPQPAAAAGLPAFSLAI